MCVAKINLMFKTQGGFECDFQVGFWLWMQSAWSACVLPVVVKSLLNEYYLPFYSFWLKDISSNK